MYLKGGGVLAVLGGAMIFLWIGRWSSHVPSVDSPECVEGEFYELRLDGVLRSSRLQGSRKVGSCPRVPWVAKIFGPAKPLPLREAIASPCDKAWSCHSASALS